jgi:hypothetical protein
MSDKIVNLARARTTREFLDKYGELPVSGLSLVAAIASAREACGKSIQAVEERLGDSSPQNRSAGGCIGRAERRR